MLTKNNKMILTILIIVVAFLTLAVAFNFIMRNNNSIDDSKPYNITFIVDGEEFKKISVEISLGLDIETAFKRFADRIKLSEAIYLTSSISVLNKTGGNIIKVFNSIEKTIFNRKKLENEFKALTSSSKLIMYVLIIVPIAFVIFISLINKDYFNVLFTNPLGIVLIIIMLIIYITYIIVVRKVMKIEGIK
jgi:tight adherence protein B